MITVRERSDPIIATVFEHDSDGDGQLNRAEFTSFLTAAIRIVDRPINPARFRTVSSSIGFDLVSIGSVTRVERRFIPVKLVSASGRAFFYLGSIKSKPLAAAWGLEAPSVVAVPQSKLPYADRVYAQLNRDSSAAAMNSYLVGGFALTWGADEARVNSPITDALNQTSEDFSLLDLDNDGYLTQDEVATLMEATANGADEIRNAPR